MPRDQWHEKALRAVRPGMSFFTSASVINETISLLQARGFFSAAISLLREARLAESVSVVCAVLQSDGWANAIDCVSFAVMRKLSTGRRLHSTSISASRDSIFFVSWERVWRPAAGVDARPTKSVTTYSAPCK
jgi:hypothetical protein